MNNKIFYKASFIVLLVGGFIFRLIGIVQNLSGWNDEIFTSLMSRYILKRGLPITDFGYSDGVYQIGLYYLTAFSYYLSGGTSEVAARIPSVIAGILLIVAIFLIVNSLLKNRKVALMSTVLASFSQIQLAWSTQIRPYIWLELFCLVAIYYAYKFIQNKKQFIDHNVFASIFLSILAVLFHGSGLITLILVALAILIKIFQSRRYKFIFIIAPLVIFSLLILRYSFGNAIPMIFKFDFRVWHYIAFFKEYIWLLIPAFFGALHLWYKDRNLFIVLPVFIVIIFALAIFKLNTQYVRYSLPAMPLLYILFSIGFFAMLDLFTFKQSKKEKTIITIIMLLGFIGTPIVNRKIIFWPKYYYSINNDVRENPIVDYKLAFQKIKEMIEDKPNVILMDAWIDRVPYYLPGHKFIFLSRTYENKNPHYKTINSIALFNEERKNYPFGIVIVENWESMTPPELQDYIRKTLKHEFDVDSLPYNENDKWSISIYSWGFDKNTKP